MDKLQNIIDGLVAEKSLSFDVLDQLKSVKDESTRLQEKSKETSDLLNSCKNEIETKRLSIVDLESKNKVLIEKIVAYEKREDELKHFEHQKELFSVREQSALNRLNDVKEVFSIVFKNTITRESVTKSTNTPLVVNGYVQQQYSTNTESTETRNETD